MAAGEAFLLAMCEQSVSLWLNLSGTHWSVQSHWAKGKARFLVSSWLSGTGARDSSSAWESCKSGKLKGYQPERLWSLLHFFPLQKSKMTHVTTHAIPAPSMYEMYFFFGRERRKWGSPAKQNHGLSCSFWRFLSSTDNSRFLLQR